MPHAAIGGMQLKSWTGYLKIIWPTIRVLGQAKKAKGCLHADMFKDGQVYFAVSVWDNQDDMKVFARSGLHADLQKMAHSTMSMFYNHTHEFDAMPSREQSVNAWKNVMNERDGQGSVGVLRT